MPPAPRDTPSAPLAVAPPAGRARSRWRRRVVHAAVVSTVLAVQPVTALAAPRRPVRDTVASDLFRQEQPPDLDMDYGRVLSEAIATMRRYPGTPVAQPIAHFEDVDIVAPSHDVEVAGFHESFSADAPPMAATGPVAADHNARPGGQADFRSGDGNIPLVVLPTRRRAGGPTSAMDVAVVPGTAVVAPVSGTVRRVTPYWLYGRHPDVRVEIEPDGRRTLRLVVLHVSDVSVAPGDVVEAGTTPIAKHATVLPFEGQVDRFAIEAAGRAEGPHPHVHLELQRVE